MDLVTFTASGLKAIGWNLLSNATSDASGEAADALQRRWTDARASIPSDDAVRWAVRRSALQATRAACHAGLRGLGVSPSTPMSLPWNGAPSSSERTRRLDRIPAHRREVARWLDTVDEALLEEVRAGAASMSTMDSEDEAAAASTGSTAEGDVDAQAQHRRDAFLDAMLTELGERFGSVPERMADLCREGWSQAGAGRVTWFEAYAAFFRQAYLDDDAVRRLLDRSALGEIRHDVQTVEEALRTLGGNLIRRLDAVEAATRDLQANVPGNLRELLREHRDAILLALAENTSATPSDVLVPFTRHVLLRQVYQGEEVAAKVERIVREKTDVFAGREAEMERLDRFVDANAKGVFVVTAPAGMGKSGLLAEWTRTRHGHLGYVAHHFFSTDYPAFTRSIDQGLVNLLRQCHAYTARTASDQPDGLAALAQVDIPNGGPKLLGAFTRFWNEFTRVPGEPLILVIDALDEADEALPLFIDPLPEGVYVIVSARASGDDMPPYLQNWVNGAPDLKLDRLPRPALRDWLREAGEGELRHHADDDDFVAALDRATEGFPLYVRFLIEDLIAADPMERRAILERQPGGFEKYVEAELDALIDKDLSPSLYRFLALLCVALGPLPRADVKDLLEVTGRELRTIVRRWPVVRWIRTRREEDDVYVFAHPRLATAFAAVRHFEDDVQYAQTVLLGYCARWAEHESLYALRHYPAHLLDRFQQEGHDASRTKLYDLARNQDFLDAQELHAGGSSAALGTCEAALQAAMDANDTGGMAEFVMRHTQRLDQTRRARSPLQVLRDRTLHAAWAQADLFETEHRILWYLLIAWELADTDRSDAASETLRRLEPLAIPITSKARRKQAVLFLEQLWTVNAERVLRLLAQLAHPATALQTFASAWGRSESDAGDGATARKQAIQDRPIGGRDILGVVQEVATSIPNGQTKVEALTAVAEAYSAQGDAEAALEAAMQIPDEVVQAQVLIDVARVYAEQGDAETALESVRQIPMDWATAEALTAVAVALAEGGDAEAAQDAAAQISFERWKAEALTAVARAYAAQGDVEAARTVLRSAQDAAAKIPNESGKAEVLAAVAYELAAQGDAEAAKKVALQIAKEQAKSEALTAVARVLAAQGDVEAARTVLRSALEAAAQIPNAWGRAEALTAVAKTLVAQGDVEAARTVLRSALEAAARIPNAWGRVEALTAVAKTLVAQGDVEAVREAVMQIPEEQAKAEALTAVARAYAEQGDAEAAQEVAKQIPKEQSRAEALTAVAVALAERGDVEAAQDVAMQIPKEQSRAEALTAVAVALAEGGDANAAEKVALQIAKEQAKAEALTAVAEAYSAQGDAEAARTVLRSAQDAAAQIPNEWRKAEALTAVARAYAEQGEAEAARDAAAQISDELQQVRALVASVHGNPSSGDKMWTRNILEIAIQRANEITNPERRTAARTWVAFAFVESGHPRDGRRLFEDLRLTARTLPSAGHRDRGLWVTADLLSFATVHRKGGTIDYEIIRRAFSQIVQAVDSSTLRVRVEDQAEAVRSFHTGEWKSEIQDGQSGSRSALIQLARDLARHIAFEHDEYRRTATRLVQTMVTLEAPSSWFEHLVDQQRKLLYADCAPHSVPEMIRQTLDEILQDSLRIETPTPRYNALGRLARIWASLGSSDDADQVFHQIPEAAREVFQVVWDNVGRRLRDYHPGALLIGRFNAGELDRVRTQINRSTTTRERADHTWRLARLQVVHDVESAAATLRQALRLPVDHTAEMQRTADVCADRGHAGLLKMLLVPMAHSVEAGWSAPGMLALLDPDHVVDVAEAIDRVLSEEDPALRSTDAAA